MCEKCKPYGGLWMATPVGMKRCDCAEAAKAKAAEDARKNPEYRQPVLSAKDTEIFVEMLAAIPFFPGESGARLIIAEELRSLCAGPAEALWLVQRMVRLYQKWPGLREMRIVYCSKHLPLDGIPESGSSDIYPDGIPSERPQPALGLPGGSQLALPSGHDVSVSPSIENAVHGLAEAKSIKRLMAADPFTEPTPPAEIPLVKPAGKRVTQADIDAAVLKLRQQKLAEVDESARELIGNASESEL